MAAVNENTAQASVSCPVCGAACKEPPVETYTAEQSAAHFFPVTRDADRHRRLAACVRRLWGSDRTQVMHCGRCGFGFGHPHVGGDEEFYSILHESASYPGDRWEYRETIAAAVRRFPQGGKALDIGSGDGSFLRHLPEGWTRHGTESTETTRALLRERGIGVFPSLDAAVEEAAGTFQLVTAFQVLEHIAGFREVLGSISRLLAPGGLLALSTPDSDKLLRQQRATRYPDMPPNHINRWSARSLSLALEQSGLRVLQASSEPDGFKHVPYSLYLRVRADSTRPGSLAAQAYRIRGRKARSIVLRGVGLLTAPKVLVHWGAAATGNSLLAIGERPPE